MKNLMRCASFAVLLALWVPAQTLAQAQPPPGDQPDEDTEEIIVTGSFIQGTPEDAALPVNVINSEDLVQLGAPSINELLRNNNVTQGLIAETNQFDTRGGQANEGATTINLRGLGPARTLVLMNGRRHVATEAIGVDVSMIPMIAVERLEILKDGAAALYGSDAIGGVVNFITRKSFEGVELRASHQFIEDSDGDSDFSGIFGYSGDNWNFSIAGEYQIRSELNIKDRNWALLPFAQNPQGGWSSIGNPGTFFATPPFATPFLPDPNCDALGGSNAAGFCRFQYTYFDNLIEDTDIFKIFAQGEYEFGEHRLHLEGLYSQVQISEWKTSPAYPPQTLIANSNLVLPDHPGRMAFEAANPAFAATLGAGDWIYWGRYTGVAGNFGEPETSRRETEQWRFGASLSGPLSDSGLSYDIAVTYSERERILGQFHDMYVERFAFGLRGLGGPNCDPATGSPGVGPCEYYNPFSNAFASSAVTGANPFFDPSVANSPELLQWLVGEGSSLVTNELLVFDGVISGSTGVELPGGEIGFAVGAQSRNEEYELSVNSLFDITQNPCPYTNPESIAIGFTTSLDCSSPTGLFAFLSGTIPNNLERTIYAVFGELAVPVFDTVDVQLALRFEDYGGDTGSTVDPKIAARWQATDWLAFRGSASTTFRGPPQSALTGRVTNLAFINQALAFKALDTVGNPNLKPEEAVATNVGLLVDFGNFRGSVDYWRFDFTDPLQLEDGNQIVGAYNANDCADGGAGVGTSACDSLRARIFPTGVVAGGLERIERSIINGSDVVTDGIDVASQFDFDLSGVNLTVGALATYTLQYDSDDFVDIGGLKLADGGDFVGFLNEGTPFQPLVKLKGSAYLRANFGGHTATYTLRYTDDYRDSDTTALKKLRRIDDQFTHDFTYNLELFEGRTRFSFSVFNITDEDPPQASTDLNYDPYTHSAFGRMFKIGLTQSF